MEFYLSIIIVNWNTREQTLTCIKSIMRYSDDQACVQVVVVDNASDDGPQSALREISDSVELIENQENLGFGRANNVGLKSATGRVVLFLNSDTEITEGFISNLLKEFDLHPDIAAFGCKILGYDDVPQHSVRGFPSLTACLYSD
ncbi:MAG: glycosyltransferase family 2 protein [Candidatus Polarisedimenticolaceae bacterium]|nr:glycosyltransferase family 2 protein [Candidatus Polarisedimenticolaceae bacterium]